MLIRGTLSSIVRRSLCQHPRRNFVRPQFAVRLQALVAEVHSQTAVLPVVSGKLIRIGSNCILDKYTD
jgi:hypothetical protein